jgi:hypothetical protein
MRDARNRHQGTKEGRDDHRDRQADYRERLRLRVTDQGRGEASSSGTVASAGRTVVEVTTLSLSAEEQGDVERGSRKRLGREVRCAVCGRTSRWVVWWPVPRCRREPPRRN